MTDSEIKEVCLQEAGIDLGRYSYAELTEIKDALRRYHNAKLKLFNTTKKLKALLEEMEERATRHAKNAIASEDIINEGKYSESQFIIEKLKLILNEEGNENKKNYSSINIVSIVESVYLLCDCILYNRA